MLGAWLLLLSDQLVRLGSKVVVPLSLALGSSVFGYSLGAGAASCYWLCGDSLAACMTARLGVSAQMCSQERDMPVTSNKVL